MFAIIFSKIDLPLRSAAPSRCEIFLRPPVLESGKRVAPQPTSGRQLFLTWPDSGKTYKKFMTIDLRLLS